MVKLYLCGAVYKIVFIKKRIMEKYAMRKRISNLLDYRKHANFQSNRANNDQIVQTNLHVMYSNKRCVDIAMPPTLWHLKFRLFGRSYSIDSAVVFNQLGIF